MKYRRLRQDELEQFEEEFVKFLASNHVTAEDWEQLKADSPKKVEGLIEIFSDIIFDKVLATVEYLEWRRPKDFRTFHFAENNIQLLGILATRSRTIDFTAGDPILQIIEKAKSENSALQLFSAERTYKKEKAIEIFELLEQGALISRDGKVFKALQTIKSK